MAEQSSPRRNVVLKLLRPELSHDDAFRRRFIHESEAAASTEHPNIVPIYAAGEAEGDRYIAMRYIDGTDLRELISSERSLAPDRAVEIVSQVASALDAAHARGLVHRDVKPGNVLLDRHGNAYLTDFGLIKRSEVDTRLTKTGQFMGSIEYCAPEQIRGDEVDGRVDVYSLACVLFESIAGRPPFRRDTEIATLYAHLEQQPPKLSAGASDPLKELDGVIARAMAKRSSDRYPTAGAFARAARHAVGASSGEREAVPARGRRGGARPRRSGLDRRRAGHHRPARAGRLDRQRTNGDGHRLDPGRRLGRSPRSGRRVRQLRPSGASPCRRRPSSPTVSRSGKAASGWDRG